MAGMQRDLSPTPQLHVVPLQRPPHSSVQKSERLVQIGASPQFPALRGDERGLALEDEEQRAEA